MSTTSNRWRQTSTRANPRVASSAKSRRTNPDRRWRTGRNPPGPPGRAPRPCPRTSLTLGHEPDKGIRGAGWSASWCVMRNRGSFSSHSSWPRRSRPVARPRSSGGSPPLPPACMFSQTLRTRSPRLSAMARVAAYPGSLVDVRGPPHQGFESVVAEGLEELLEQRFLARHRLGTDDVRPRDLRAVLLQPHLRDRPAGTAARAPGPAIWVARRSMSMPCRLWARIRPGTVPPQVFERRVVLLGARARGRGRRRLPRRSSAAGRSSRAGSGRCRRPGRGS